MPWSGCSALHGVNRNLKKKRYFFFSQGSNVAGKNEFISQYTSAQPHFSVKYKYKINDNYHVPHTHISNTERRWTTF